MAVVDAEYARYDVSDLGPTALAQLADLLDAMAIAHAVELGVLLVFAVDELMVDIALDEIERAGHRRVGVGLGGYEASMADTPVRTEPANRRARAFLGGEVVVDTIDALYVWEIPYYPQWYLPLADVTEGALEPTATTTESASRGIATHCTVRAGGREAVDAGWRYADSPVELLRDRVRIAWEAMDAWFEEDEEVFVHPRDPNARIAILPSSRHVVVAVDGVVVADSVRPTFLHESRLPMRTYLPKTDVRMDLLVPTSTQTQCPYKGTADYWTLQLGEGRAFADVAWGCALPRRESVPIAGLVAFDDTKVDVTIDGVPRPRLER